MLRAQEERIALYRQLSALSDPIQRLPFEISSQIFVYCVQADAPSPKKRLDPRFPVIHYTYPVVDRAPVLLLGVCHGWTQLALNIQGASLCRCCHSREAGLSG